MRTDLAKTPNQIQPLWRRLLQLALLGALAAPLGGCMDNLAGINCKQVKANVLQVAQDGKCRFRYSRGDLAKYVVIITRAPTYGEAAGQGPYLHYVAKPGFKGEDQLSIKVERRGVGHVQWENLVVKVKVGSNV